MRTLAAQARHTPYMAMSIKSNQIPTQYNALAAVCAWITLAGFIVLPNTFTSIERSGKLGQHEGGKALQEAVRNVQLLPLASVLCGLGFVGTCWLWWKWQANYVWLIAHLFVPGVSHSLIALFSVVISIATSQDGELSVTAKVSISIVSALCGVMIMLTVVYTKLLDNIITPFDRQVARQ
ncbi:hypothetical protein B0T11DRAFT_229284 [Plectosphaerella cucumerina]|uniref:Uncharacterized protein n=1 Tax=Plectosphaerella cucumerina TaxID=40658 RepID=A0A8K0X2E6_9PEZI|nr:hypothetical protein B0T11DRAFT_229284 [Plectosphaerella cucumerina]